MIYYKEYKKKCKLRIKVRGISREDNKYRKKVILLELDI